MTAAEFNPPQDIPAEQAVLGAMLISDEAVRAVVEVVQPDDFYRPAHAMIYEAMTELFTHGERVDAISVHATLSRKNMSARVGGAPYLHTLMSSVPTAASAGYYAERVAERAGQRRIVEAGQRITQMGYQDEKLADQAAYARDQIAQAIDGRVGVNHLTVPIEEFMTNSPEKPDWVIPNFLARGDRVVVTGKGGTGKSTLARQVNVCAAAGLDPLTFRPLDKPLRVTVLDKENSDYQNHNTYGPLLDLARRATGGEGVNGRLSISGLSGRINLLDSRDALSVLRTIEREKPDHVYIGPYYKLRGGADPNEEGTVLAFTQVLDQIREMGACTWTEAHPNKGADNGGNLAPSGSNMWNWWPEFGFGFRQDPDALTYRRVFLERWRVDRVDAMWPDVLEAGGTGHWPWVEGMPR